MVFSGMSKNLSMDGAGAPRVSKSAKQRLKSMVLGQSATDRVEGWHKVDRNYTSLFSQKVKTCGKNKATLF